MSLFFVFLGEVGGREGANLWGGGQVFELGFWEGCYEVLRVDECGNAGGCGKEGVLVSRLCRRKAWPDVHSSGLDLGNARKRMPYQDMAYSVF